MKRLKNLGKFKLASLVLMFALGFTLIGTGAVFAYYNVHTTTINGTVSEAFTVQYWDGAAWQESGTAYTWNFTAYPGETHTLILRVSNAGSVALTAHVSGSDASIGGTGDYAVPAGGVSANIPLTYTVAADASPTSFTSYIWVGR